MKEVRLLLKIHIIGLCMGNDDSRSGTTCMRDQSPIHPLVFVHPLRISFRLVCSVNKRVVDLDQSLELQLVVEPFGSRRHR